jgi:hypothetical protein
VPETTEAFVPNRAFVTPALPAARLLNWDLAKVELFVALWLPAKLELEPLELKALECEFSILERA